MMQDNILFRSFLKEKDLPVLRNILESTDYFYTEEVNIALEIAQEYLLKGEGASGYHFILAETESLAIAFAIYGKILGTEDSFDLYWIAVHEEFQGKGIGKILLRKVEDVVIGLSGRHIWIETSSRPLYEPTRKFYLKMGYRITAELPHFYALNDHKIIFVKLV
ncbi:MAG: GNAT family N-acetyltransferase [Candidatus Neomarinimicrobiota bacterium]|jgi:ribosomal protein S18 acetylase RimI-like enzyme